VSERRAHKVVALGPVHNIPGRNSAVVAFLADLLVKAKRGEVAGVAIAYVDGSNSLVTDWDSGRADSHLMIAATTQLQHLMLKRQYDAD
jgi:hypothetical protein